MSLPNPIVLDKSYLVAAKAATIRELCANRQVLVNEALLFETLKDAEHADRRRRSLIGKLPPGLSPVRLVPHAGVLYRRELTTHRPTTATSDPLPERYEFSELLQQGRFQLHPSHRTGLAAWDSFVRETLEIMTREVATFNQPFRGHAIDSEPGLAQFDAELQDLAFIQRFYAWIRPDGGPRSDSLTNDWFLTSWLRARLYYVARWRHTWGPDLLGSSETKLLHDIQDLQYVALAAWVGAIATNDNGVAKAVAATGGKAEIVRHLGARERSIPSAPTHSRTASLSSRDAAGSTAASDLDTSARDPHAD